MAEYEKVKMKPGRSRSTVPQISTLKIRRAHKAYEQGQTLEYLQDYLQLTRKQLTDLIEKKRWKRITNEETDAQAQKLVENTLLKPLKPQSYSAVISCKKQLLIAHAAEWAGVRDTLNPILESFGINAQEERVTLTNLKLVADILEKTQAGERRALGVTDEVIARVTTEAEKVDTSVVEFEAIVRRLQSEV